MRFLHGLALLATLVADTVWATGLYGKNSAVLQVDGKDFNKRIKFDQKASMVESVMAARTR
jgi:hypothetical protein